MVTAWQDGAGEPVDDAAAANQAQQEGGVENGEIGDGGGVGQPLGQRQDDGKDQGGGADDGGADEHGLGGGLEGVAGAVVVFQQ